ncbi:AimR family lysis-lysogeny pheromone receptor [Litchfieldia salsa]|uniref:Uncharacterized protein n=1 Tax=Litchfieldia salsa TaxID=930152 RepID=A0A1H0WWY0_9BACI|nr:AimR family lysis-lysogeny pheromone receptor [Litchfieldia salsa]SDP94746.1 hypothetical protein SAMN05216565_1171 [Litchfieldia salsa]
MSDLKRLLLKKIESDASLVNVLLKSTELKSHSQLKKYFNSTKEVLEFSTVLKIIQELFPSSEIELMCDYIKSIPTYKRQARYALEYLSCNRQDELLDEIIAKLLRSFNRKNREWAMIYRIDRRVSIGDLSPKDALNQLQSLTLLTKEMKIFSNYQRSYCAFNTYPFQEQYEELKSVESSLSKIKDSYVQESYTARYGLIMTAICVHLEKNSEMLRYGQLVLGCNGQDIMKCLTHIQIGNSYIISHFDNAIFHFNKAMEYCGQDTKLLEIKRSLNFIHNFWGKQPPYLNKDSKNPSDVHEVAFYYIQQGNSMKAMSILQSLDWEELSKSQKAFHLYFRGLALNERSYFFDSIRYFNEISMKNYRKLPLIALKKMGEDNSIIQALEQDMA